jgi:hypothetical protein
MPTYFFPLLSCLTPLVNNSILNKYLPEISGGSCIPPVSSFKFVQRKLCIKSPAAIGFDRLEISRRWIKSGRGKTSGPQPKKIGKVKLQQIKRYVLPTTFSISRRKHTELQRTQFQYIYIYFYVNRKTKSLLPPPLPNTISFVIFSPWTKTNQTRFTLHNFIFF